MSWFLTFEGLDGSGKTTQIARLRTLLAACGQQAFFTREPGGTALGEELRSLLLPRQQAAVVPVAEALLMSAARAQLVATAIRPRLDRGEPVVCDRYADSTLAYQGYGRGLGLDGLRAVTQFATAGLRPTLTVLLDIEVTEAAQRRSRAELGAPPGSGDFFDHAGLDFRQRVRHGYLQLAADEPERWVIVDAMASIEEVHRRISDAVSHLWTEGRKRG